MLAYIMEQFKYLVVDELGEGVRKFYSLNEAKHFISNKPELRLNKLSFKPNEEVVNQLIRDSLAKYGEPPF